MFEIEAGGWVKLVNGTTVINGNVVSVTGSYIQIQGLYPIPLKDWTAIIVKPAPGKTTPIRKTANGTDG
jgi:hypothetical protein